MVEALPGKNVMVNDSFRSYFHTDKMSTHMALLTACYFASFYAYSDCRHFTFFANMCFPSYEDLIIMRNCIIGAGGNQGWWWIPTATVLTLEDALDAQVVRKDNVIKEYKEV